MLTSQARRAGRGGRRRPDVRSAILTAARRLYFEHGADGVTARRIASAVGVSPTAIYVHYRNLDEVLEHLRMEGHALLATALRAVEPTLPAVERVNAMGRAYYRFGTANPGYYALMFNVRPDETPRREAVQREMHTLMLLRDVVTSGIARGEIRGDLDPLVATNALWAQIHGITALAVSGLLLHTALGHHDQVLEAILAGAARWLEVPRRRRG
jgi:AcrR family transcriptional regulator